MIISMTGYGNYEGENEKISFSMELKSINSKYFESSIKLPYLFSSQEQKISDILKKGLVRGRINFKLNYRIKKIDESIYTLDEFKLNNYIKILNDIKSISKIESHISLDNILNFQDIVSPKEIVEDKSVLDLLYATLEETLKQHKAFRVREGKNLEKDILGSLSRIKKNTQKIEEVWQTEKENYFKKYSAKIEGIIDKYDLNNDRLFQEVAIILDKRDINEEIVRIKSHIDSFISYVEEYSDLGKRLTFLIQELFREANTIASKSEIIGINQMVIEIKTDLEKIKEQVQNIL